MRSLLSVIGRSPISKDESQYCAKNHQNELDLDQDCTGSESSQGEDVSLRLKRTKLLHEFEASNEEAKHGTAPSSDSPPLKQAISSRPNGTIVGLDAVTELLVKANLNNQKLLFLKNALISDLRHGLRWHDIQPRVLITECVERETAEINLQLEKLAPALSRFDPSNFYLPDNKPSDSTKKSLINTIKSNGQQDEIHKAQYYTEEEMINSYMSQYMSESNQDQVESEYYSTLKHDSMDYRGQGEDVIPDSSDEFELIEDDQKAHSSFQKQYQDQDPDEDLIFLSSQEFKQSENSRLVESSPPSTIHFSQPDVTSNDVEKYSWIPEVYDNLYNRFNLEHFRNNQLEAINATLSGQDVLVLMPTGGGKSLCYQLPAMIKCNRGPMTTLVISPLLSLMEDQVFSLLEKDIVADMISSNESKIKKKLLLQSLAKNELSLLYVSPEMLNTNKTLKKTLLKLASQKQLARFVIDEAHCVSSWGHDFRPDYKVLDNLKHEFPLVPIMALTATANDKVCQDIVGCLRSNNYRLFKQSFNRPNLTYEVVIKDNDKQTMEYIVKFITQRHPGQAGIIYCHSRAECEKTAFELKKARIKAEHYHSSLDSNFKTQVQMSWQRGKLQVICATVAFGMGIDKADVRYVVHLTMSKNIEGYYQETGRAGRDGKPSDCILLYNYKDTSRVRNLINTNDNVDDTARTVSKNMLTDMIMYAENSVICRRAQILKYFGEDISNLKCHKKCDNCKRNNVNNMIEKDMTEISQAIIRLIEKLQRDRVTITYCVDVIKGAKAKKIVQAGHDRLVGYGAGKDIDKETISRILYHLVAQRILDEYSIVNNAGFAQSYLHLSDRCRDVNKGYLRVKVKFPRQEIVGDGKFTHLKAPTQAKNKQKAKTSIEKDKLQKRIQFRPSQMPGATKDIGKPSAGPGESHTNDRFVDNVKILSGAREERKKQLEASRADAVVNKATLEDMANKLPKDKESFSQLDKIKPAQVEAHYEHFKRYIALIRLTQGKTDIEEK